MSLVIAALLYTAMPAGPAATPVTTSTPAQAARTAPAVTPEQAMADSQAAAYAAAQGWLALVDNGEYAESWSKAGAMFRAQVSADDWAGKVGPVRTPLGAAETREMTNAMAAANLPGAPEGDYMVFSIDTDFAQMKGAVETVTLVREAGGWAVIGYFIRPA